MIKNRVPEILAQNNLSAGKLERELAGKVARNSVYSWTRGTVSRVDLDTLANVITALRKLTGQPLQIQDVMTYEPADELETVGA